MRDYCDVGQPADSVDTRDLLVTYFKYEGSERSYLKTAKDLRPMWSDLTPGGPRASYDGIVIVRCGERRFFLKPLHS